MKKILLAVGMLLISTTVRAETSLFNFGDFFHSMRAGYAINQHGEKSEIFYTAIQKFHSQAGVEFVSVNVGYESAQKRPAVSMGVRADNIIPMIWGGKWGKAHVTTAKLPTLEFGPYLSIWPKDSGNLWRMDVWYGLSAAIGF